MNEPKLERCPFCGASAEFYEFKRSRTEMIGVMTDSSISHPLPSQYLARCTNKDCNGNTPGTKFFWTKEDAATAWNRRTPLPDNKALTAEEVVANMEMFTAYRHVCGGLPPERIAELFKAEQKRREGCKYCDNHAYVIHIEYKVPAHMNHCYACGRDLRGESHD